MTETYSKAGEFVTRNIAGETIIVPVSSRVADLEAVYTMGDVGRQIWEMVDGSHSSEEIARSVADRWGIDLARAQADVGEFLAALEEAGLAARTGEQP